MSINRNYIIGLLIVVFVTIGAAVFFMDNGTDRSFKKSVVSVDTSKVHTISILRPNADTLVNICRVKDSWMLRVSSGYMDANEEKVFELLSHISDIQVIRQMSNSEKVWERYGVVDSLAIRVIVRGNKSQLADFYCGNTDFDRQTNQIYCYVRNVGDNRTYKVDGLLSLVLSGNFDAWVRKYS